MRLREMAAIIEANLDGLTVHRGHAATVGSQALVEVAPVRSVLVATLRGLATVPALAASVLPTPLR